MGLPPHLDVIDLDPYGSASPFLDGAVQAVADGGLLCITCTDMSVFCGNYPEVCFAKYGAVPLKARYGHEMALRILLHAIDTAANKHRRYVEPWLSMSIDYYMRVFVRVHESAAEVKNSVTRRAMVLQSTQCPSFFLQPLGAHNERKDNYAPAVVTAPSSCEESGGGRLRVGGPVWSAPIHKHDVLEELLARVSALIVESDDHDDADGDGDKADHHDHDDDAKPPQDKRIKYDEADTSSSSSEPHHDDPHQHGHRRRRVVDGCWTSTALRLEGLLTAMSEELVDVPLHYHLPDMASLFHSPVPHLIHVQAALVNAGYRVSQFHHEPNAVKTDAPPHVLWDIMRAYVAMHPPTGSAFRPLSDLSKHMMSKVTD